MVVDLSLAQQATEFVDLESGLVDRKIFSDEAIYQLELEQIFARAWNFIVHESQIPNAGDFFQTAVGEDRVIAVRDRDGKVQVLLNSCRHRGNAVCRAEEGNVTSFMCTYHGWTYDLDGKLIGVPGYKEVYHEELDRENWGLIKPAQVESYKGFVFACMDPDAPGLEEYLGKTGRISLDAVADQGDMEVINGLTKYTIQANWKLCTDNTWDFYHGQVTHASVRVIDPYGDQPRDQSGELDKKLQFSYRTEGVKVLLSEYGHVAAGGGTGAQNPRRTDLVEVMRRARQVGNRCIFPNLFMIGNQMELRIPKGPTTTEVWMFGFVDKQATPEMRDKVRSRQLHSFAPAGFHEQDDGENWDQSTAGCQGVVAKRFPLNYAMGLGHGEVIDDGDQPPHINTGVSEHPQLWMYYCWAQMMAAPSWREYRANPPRPEGRM